MSEYNADEAIHYIQWLSAKMPSGAIDPKAADKLVAERNELLEALDWGDTVGALTEVADAGYYAVKHLAYVASLFGISAEDVLALTIAKYELRALPGNPKNDAAERIAVGEKFDEISVKIR